MRKTITNLYEEYVERHNGKPKHSFSHFIRVMSHIIHHKEEIKPQIIWWSDVNKTIRIMNKFKLKKYVGDTLYYVFIVVFLWIAISCFIQRFKCPSMTETQLFLHIPKSFVCDWQLCE